MVIHRLSWVPDSCTQPFYIKRYSMHSLRQELASWCLVTFENQLKPRTDKEFDWRVFISNNTLTKTVIPFFIILFIYFFSKEKHQIRSRGNDNEIIQGTRSENPSSPAKDHQELPNKVTVQRNWVCTNGQCSLVLFMEASEWISG